MTQTVLILGGTGKIGTHAARAFGAAGWEVRHYDRATGDMTAAAQGCDVIVNGLNPPNYHAWDRLVPQITRQVIAAAQASGATVIIPGNVYNFGLDARVITADTPQAPVSRKGRIRVELERAYRASGVRTIVLRAGNFIDPDRNGDILSMVVLAKAGRGKITAMGDPAVDQAWAYLPDWARAAQQLAEIRAELPAFADIPFPGHTFSTNDLRDTLADRLGRRFRIVQFPWWLMTALSPVWELARELREMRYLASMPHRLDGAALSALLPDFRATPMAEAMLAGLPRDVHPDQPVRTGGETVLTQ